MAHILTITILALIILVTFLAASLVDVIADIICAREPKASELNEDTGPTENDPSILVMRNADEVVWAGSLAEFADAKRAAIRRAGLENLLAPEYFTKFPRKPLRF